MKIKECLTENPELITPDTTIGEAAKKMSERDIGSLFIKKNEKLVGVVTDRDIVTRALAKGLNEQSPVSEIMSEGVLYCFQDDTVDEVAENLAQNQVHRLPVLDENKKLVGVVSLGDIARIGGEKDAIASAVTGISQPTKGTSQY